MWHQARQRLKLRQLDLQLRSAELRIGLVNDARELREPMRWMDRGHAAWRLLHSLPLGWRAAGALGGLSGLAGLIALFRRPGRVARWWAWLSLGRRVWRMWAKAPKPDAAASPTPPSTSPASPTP